MRMLFEEALIHFNNVHISLFFLTPSCMQCLRYSHGAAKIASSSVLTQDVIRKGMNKERGRK